MYYFCKFSFMDIYAKNKEKITMKILIGYKI